MQQGAGPLDPRRSRSAALVRIDEPAIGIDLFIGEPDLVGRGIGPTLIRRFLRDVAFPRYDVDLCVIAPATSNIAAIRAYEKAGFRRRGTFMEPGTREPEHILLTLRRSYLADRPSGPSRSR